MPSRPVRYELDIPVNCSTSGFFVQNRVTNISRGGLFIQSADPLPLDAEIDLAFTLPDTGATILATGRVVWNYDIAKGSTRILPGSGIKFVDMAPGDKDLLEACLEKLGAPAPASPQRPPRS
jgi:uncharacterized protein (TIGR02266 family)